MYCEIKQGDCKMSGSGNCWCSKKDEKEKEQNRKDREQLKSWKRGGGLT